MSTIDLNQQLSALASLEAEWSRMRKCGWLRHYHQPSRYLHNLITTLSFCPAPITHTPQGTLSSALSLLT
jgi:hypothetical protein